MAKGVKKKNVAIGKNIRFSDKGHATLSLFCKKKGYNLGAFCEIASLDKLREESTKLGSNNS